ncbi:MAG TPA: hypothetical protein VLT33_37710 [Labilithrix sp.]|nr:hypothetical protein [Labilithrix sp.]
MRRPLVVGAIFVGYGLLVACGMPDAPSDGSGRALSRLALESPLELICEDTVAPLALLAVPLAPAPTDASIDHVIDILNQCADSGPYGPFNICTTSCNRVHARCRVEGVGCRTASLICYGENAGHAINIVEIPGKGWCAVDTTASPVPPYNGAPRIYEPCFDDPRKVVTDPQLACRIMGKDTDGGPCPCVFDSVLDEPHPVNYDPKICRQQHPTDVDACRECCTTDGVVQYCRGEGIDCKDFVLQCLAACRAPAPDAAAADAARSDAR